MWKAGRKFKDKVGRMDAGFMAFHPPHFPLLSHFDGLLLILLTASFVRVPFGHKLAASLTPVGQPLVRTL